MDHDARWTKASFPSRLAAQDAASRMQAYVFSFAGNPLLSAENRPVLWSDYLYSPEPSLYLSPGAVDLARTLKIPILEMREIGDDELPGQRTLLLGLPDDDYSRRNGSSAATRNGFMPQRGIHFICEGRPGPDILDLLDVHVLQKPVRIGPERWLQPTVTRQDLPEEALTAFDGYASALAEVPGCMVLALYGCGSGGQKAWTREGLDGAGEVYQMYARVTTSLGEQRWCCCAAV